MTEREPHTSNDDEFERFLHEATHEVAQADAADRENQLVIERINRLLIMHGVPSFMNLDGQRTDNLMQQKDRIDAFVMQLPPEDIDADRAAQIEAWRLQTCIEEVGLLTIISMTQLAAQAAAEKSDGFQAHDRFKLQKTEIMARWMFDQKLSYDSAWTAFLNTALPGGAVQGSELDEKLGWVLEEANKKAVSMQFTSDTTERATLESGILDGWLDDDTRMSQWYSVQPILFTIALSKNGPELESACDEVARQYSLDPTRVAKFVAILQAAYNKEQ